jgi:hypothetical protein
MVPNIFLNLFSAWRLRAEIDAAIAAAVEDARESGSLSVPEDLETLNRGTRARLIALVRRTPKDVDIATDLLRQQIEDLHGQLTELGGIAERAHTLGLPGAWLLRWAVSRRSRRTIREAATLRRQVLRQERTRHQLEQWLDTRVQLVCTEYLRAKRRADHASSVAGSLVSEAEITASAPRPLALAGVN